MQKLKRKFKMPMTVKYLKFSAEDSRSYIKISI